MNFSQGELGAALVGMVSGLSLAWLALGLRYRLTIAKLVSQARGQALKASGAVLKGQAAEQLAPLSGGFPYLPADARFLGSPIDYLVFDGLSEEGPLEIVFVEVKTGQSRLSARERRVREAVEAGRCRWEELRL
ncbi:MAG: hypothetical protein KC910_26140 [Candidatus Eremiobacteraeota bacterium]|nr:hypothetical protein [Candidatus Eremiobacteraeota bacterium]